MSTTKTLPVATLIQSILGLFTEAYAGPPDPSATWFTDNVPDSGVLGIIRGVTAREASTSVDNTGNRGTTIAANVEHLRWTLANANATLRGADYNPDWKESWALLDADETAWDNLRAALNTEFETLRIAIRQQEDLSGDFLNGVLALIPHAAYHLGTIRQMIERVRKPGKASG